MDFASESEKRSRGIALNLPGGGDSSGPGKKKSVWTWFVWTSVKAFCGLQDVNYVNYGPVGVKKEGGPDVTDISYFFNLNLGIALIS